MARGDLEAARSHLQQVAPRSRAAAANLQLLDLHDAAAADSQPSSACPAPARQLLERARRAHHGSGEAVNYAEALRLYQAAADQGSASARRMLGLITSRPRPDGSVDLGWMAQLAWLDSAGRLAPIDMRSLSGMMYRDPTPLFDLLPEAWQTALGTARP